MKTLFVSIAILLSVQMLAQPSQLQRIEDTVLGWYTTQNINEAVKPYQYQGRTFTVKQQQQMMNVIEWMKKTYIPVGGLGTFRRMVFSDSYSNPPHSYGVDFRIWNVSFKKEYRDAKGNFKPVDEEYTPFGVTANAVAGGNPVVFMNTPAQYVFTWQPDGYENYRYPKMSKADPRIHPNVYKYITRTNGTNMTVYLAPGNKLPFRALSRGEFLQLALEAMDRVPGMNPTDNREGLMKLLNECRQNVQRVRDKYRNSLNEPAIINSMQPSYHDFSGDKDPFEVTVQSRNSNTLYQVYKIDKDVLEKCKSDQPQWLAIWFPFETKEDGNKLYEMFRAMQENFNYDYAYNYFFDPGKVKGVPYKPLDEEGRNARIDAYRKKEYWKSNTENKALPPNVHFMEDFSGNADGALPAGWFSSSRSQQAVVTTLKDRPGKWVQLGHMNDFVPSTSLKTPLPENFSLEFDMVTEEFNVRTGGAVTLTLSSFPVSADGHIVPNSKGTTLELNLTAGNEADYSNNNYRGEARAVISSNIGEYNGSFNKVYDLREFTNQKRLAHVQLKVKGGQAAFFVNNKQIASTTEFNQDYCKNCKSKGIPPNTLFRNLAFKNSTYNWSPDGKPEVHVYISNIKISKE